MKIETWRVISESEFSELVRETYGRPYQLQQQEPMMGQDETVFVTVPDQYGVDEEANPSFEQWRTRLVDSPPAEGEPGCRSVERSPGEWGRYDYVRELWWEREYYPPLGSVLDDLHRRDLLPAGEYHIHASW